MPGPVSDSYDPEFSTGENARNVADGIKEALDIISKTLGPKLKNVIEVAQGPPGKSVSVRLTERQRRLIRFGLNRALEDI